MSLDVTLYVYFPVSETKAALRALGNIMPPRRRGKTVKIIAPDGEKFELPSEDEFLKKGKSYPLEGDGVCFETLIAVEKDGGEDSWVPVEMSLELGCEFLEISLSSIASVLVPLYYLPPFRARIAELMDEGRGVTAAYESMGVWQPFSQPDGRVMVPDDCDRHGSGIDKFAGFLVKRTVSDG